MCATDKNNNSTDFQLIISEITLHITIIFFFVFPYFAALGSLGHILHRLPGLVSLKSGDYRLIKNHISRQFFNASRDIMCLEEGRGAIQVSRMNE